MTLLRKIWSVLIMEYVKNSPANIISNHQTATPALEGEELEITSLFQEFITNLFLLIISVVIFYLIDLLGAFKSDNSILWLIMFLPLIFLMVRCVLFIIILPVRVIYRLFTS